MDSSYLGNLRIWEDAPAAAWRDVPRAHCDPVILPGPHRAADFAERLFASEALNPHERAGSSSERMEPYTLQWFLNIESERHERHGRWIPRLLEFAKHSGETLLGMGSGLGTDWLQYARHGAGVVVCSPSAEQLALVRRNFELRGLKSRFLHAIPEVLPLEAASIDVACVNGLLHEVNDPQAVVNEIYRVLKPGGKVLAITRARFDIDFWFRVCFPWEGYWRRQPTSSPIRQIRFTGRGLRRLFGRFVEHRVHKRHLSRADIPHRWRWAPRGMLQRWMGRILVLKAFKPLSAAIAEQAAA
jgi:ubiquinone/menaquinone biosynthesis C-methylase UbiE